MTNYEACVNALATRCIMIKLIKLNTIHMKYIYMILVLEFYDLSKLENAKFKYSTRITCKITANSIID